MRCKVKTPATTGMSRLVTCNKGGHLQQRRWLALTNGCAAPRPTVFLFHVSCSVEVTFPLALRSRMQQQHVSCTSHQECCSLNLSSHGISPTIFSAVSEF
eukprot:3217936-Rhodomonas_salina.1